MLLQLTDRDVRANGVSMEWYGERQLVFITVQESSRQAVDTTVEVFFEVATGWDISKPYMVGFEVMGNVLLTPYARQRFATTTNMNPDVWGRYALIVPPSLLGQTITMFFNYEYRTRTSARLVGRAFVRRATAYAWLTELLIQD